MVHNCSTGTEKLKGALGHLGEDGGEGAEGPLLSTTPLVHKEVGTVTQEPSLKVPIHSKDVEDNVDKVQKVTED